MYFQRYNISEKKIKLLHKQTSVLLDIAYSDFSLSHKLLHTKLFK